MAQVKSGTTYEDIHHAALRLIGKVQRTPILESSLLNRWFGHRILFKAECLQPTGAFKLRGATNFIAALQESGQIPKHIVANSSGNHAQAVAYAASKAGIPVTIYATETISPVKAAATQAYGAELKLFPTRVEADRAVADAAEDKDTVWIPPFNHPLIIAGQGTAAMEALQDHPDVNAIFAPCGGGGLLGGTLLATRELAPEALVIGAEPQLANDASRSLQSGRIESLPGPVSTLADGAATPSVGEHTFPLLQELDDFYEVNEQQIAYWTQWLQHLLKIHVEPTSAMSMAAVAAWAVNTPPGQTAMVLLTGGNISQSTMSKIWHTDYLLQPPTII
ncbi:MAG: serine/threonine dehydratase [Pseudomonadota bacterium]|uniref:Threonine dehydratase n=1 Tax=Marisediminitalea aggregata TaxID=634436 RepID=A0A1M5RUP3_9ALTE|nr:serine/threonine dehydratase [Marisediminitalea aggregata]MCP9478248.1 serine/threonine dehydratase [Marisediminitalea aggregata]MEC8228825.1 serine/threonine dehydratase [Pseudomonadota bacterium]SHH29758.1 threonine dehydratase [Marisediminitalea aggregata]